MRKNNTYFLTILTVISLALNTYFLKDFLLSILSKNAQKQQSKVTNIIDGDTFDLENGERIRLALINAPEYPKGCMGIDARTRLENLVSNKAVSFERLKKDNFGRMLAVVYLDNLNINEVLVEEGLAYFDRGGILNPNSLQIEKAEEKARSAGRGVWSSLYQTQKEGCLIKGNYRSSDNSRIYHTANCYNYDRITVKPGTTDRWFCSEEEAVKAGFRKSLDCPKL